MTVDTPLPPPPAAAAADAAAESVVVAINIRPLVDSELAEGCKECLLVTPGEPQVGHGAHLFTYDHVFCDRGVAEPPATLYDRCVAPLVDGLFRGYNATVFAYGQTGSGKTYTMGSAFTPGMGGAGAPRGVIPQVMDAIFGRIAAAPRDIDFSVRVGFVEIHKEEIHDLLCTRGGPHPAVHIREAGGGVCLAGAMEREVKTRQEMVEVLEQGTLLRATAATGMNKQSSRSHAIFTITLEQRRLVGPRAGGSGRASASGSPGGDDSSGDEEEEGVAEEVDDSYLCAKMHLVDLAGSERAKRTKAVGQRLQEGININKGLLALGNVINALSEGKAHVPYRDSKLTRMLQDSLGGNSRTVMIACVSPADVNLEESLNTLRYANRARNIRNKPVVNRDPVAAQIAHMRQQMAALRAENQSLKAQLGLGDGAVLDFGAPADEALRATVETLEQRNRALQSENKRLRVERDSAQEDLKDATEKMIVAQAQRDKLQQALQRVSPEAAEEAAAAAEALADGTSSEGDVVRGQLERIAELEREVKRLKQVSRLSGAFAASMRRQSLAPGEAPASPFAFTPIIQSDGEEEADVSLLEQNDDEYAAREQAQLMHQSHLHSEMARLEREMAAKEHALLSMTQHAALKQKYDERLLDLQQQRDELQRERADLMRKLEALQHASEEERLRLREQYESRIKLLDEKVKAVRAKEKRVLELERMKSKAETACKKLERDVLAIKQQKVSLHRAMEKSAKEFGEWKKQRDRELLQLKKQGRLNAAQLQKLEALHSKQQAVLRRKTEEAEAARRRLKELEDRKQRLASRPATAQPAPPSERPFTTPAAGGTAAAVAGGQPPRPPTAGGAAVERFSPSASAAASSAEAECQPNPLAPLLRDEKGRREWVEGELDAYCSSYELQKVMEGERAQRSEVQRKLREVEKALAHLRNPEWWGPASAALVSPSGDCEEKLVRRKMALLTQSEEHSKAFEAAQAKLLEARQAEDARGGVPADAKRWNGVRSVVQARALLKTLFRSASQHKAQAIEASAQVTELSEEIELLKLRLDIAEAEKFEAAQQVAKYQVLLEKAEAARSGSTEAEATTPAKQLLPPAVGPGDLAAETDEGLREAHEILQQLNTLASEDPLSAPAAPAAAGAAGGAAGTAAAGSEEQGDEESLSEEESWEEEDEDEDEEEEGSSDDEERHALWDPSLATPARGLKARKAAAAAGGEGRAQRRRRSSTASGSGGLLPEEQPVLAHLNEQRQRQGKEPVSKPTVALMKEVLKDKVIGGRRWRLGGKKREDLVKDYRLMLGLQPSEDGGAAAVASAPQAQQQQQQQQQPAGAAQHPPPSRGSDGAPAGSAPVFSRLLEHTASSLARCANKVYHPPPSVVAATQQQQPVAAAVAAAAAAAGPPTRTAFGSPLPPQRNRSSTSSQDGQQGQPDAGSTPVGAEGLTPEGMAPEVQQRDGLPSAGAALSPDGKRNLQLQDLHSQLTALAEQGAVTLGLNPNAGVPSLARPVTSGAVPSEPQRSPSPPRSGASGQQGGSPFRRSFSLAGWARSASPRSPADAAGHPAQARPDEQQPPSPGAAAAQRMDAEFKRARSGSPGRLARLFGRSGGVAADGSAAKQGGGAAAATPPMVEATYDLQQPILQDKSGLAGRPGGPASHPLRCSNSSTTSEAAVGGGSRAGSPRDAGLAASCARAPSTGPSPLEQPSGGRPRSGGSNPPGSAVPPHRSPRRQVWKPL